MPAPLQNLTAKSFHGKLLTLLSRQDFIESKNAVEALSEPHQDHDPTNLYRWINTAFHDLKVAGFADTLRKGVWTISEQGRSVLDLVDKLEILPWNPREGGHASDAECLGFWLPSERVCQTCPARGACWSKTKERLDGL